jgi:beta-phosphoglucomutase-like phosphatase (HAD superfamily)
VEKALQRNGLDFFIERIFTEGEIPAGKNSPAMYDAAASYMGLSGREICVFEDSLFAIETAAGAGYHTVWICGEKETGIKDPHRIAEICIRDLKEALPLIQAEGGS